MSSDRAVSESNRAFSLIRLTTTYQTLATPATHHVDTSGVRNRGLILANVRGTANRRAIEKAVREAGMIVVCVDAMAEVVTENRTTQSQPPKTSVAIRPKMNSSSSALAVRKSGPEKATMAYPTAR